MAKFVELVFLVLGKGLRRRVERGCVVKGDFGVYLPELRIGVIPGGSARSGAHVDTAYRYRRQASGGESAPLETGSGTLGQLGSLQAGIGVEPRKIETGRPSTLENRCLKCQQQCILFLTARSPCVCKVFPWSRWGRSSSHR